MPWDTVKLNDGWCIFSLPNYWNITEQSSSAGNPIPTLAIGTGRMGKGQVPVDQVSQAMSIGFSHIGETLVVRTQANLMYSFGPSV